MNSSEEDITKCWKFSESDPVPYAVVSVNIKHSVDSETYTIEYKVDTGFNGVIGLSGSVIHQLGLLETGTLKIRTASGETFIPYYNGIISLKSTEITDIKALILKTPRSIVGRTLINLGSWLYDGPNQKWCLL